MHKLITFTIDISADDDLSDAQTIPSNFRPVALRVPAVDSTVINFQVDRGGNGYKTVNDNDASTVGAYDLGAANTGDAEQPIPEALGRVLQGARVKIATAQQTGGDRTFVMVCERVSP